MIVHVVLFEPRADLPADARRQVLDDLQAAATTIPGVRRFRVGRRITHGLPGYEQAMRERYQYAVIIEFDDRAGLEGYLHHPAHESIGRHFATSAARALAYDFDMADALSADASRLL